MICRLSTAIWLTKVKSSLRVNLTTDKCEQNVNTSSNDGQSSQFLSRLLCCSAHIWQSSCSNLFRHHHATSTLTFEKQTLQRQRSKMQSTKKRWLSSKRGMILSFHCFEQRNIRHTLQWNEYGRMDATHTESGIESNGFHHKFLTRAWDAIFAHLYR